MSFQRPTLPVPAVQQLNLPPTDVESELAIDAQTAIRVPLRFAVARPVHFTPATHGTWEQLPNGRLWRLRLVSKGATDLNLGFTRFHLPAGATLHLISEAESYYQGPYTAADNEPTGQLWTPVVPGDMAVIELFVPKAVKEEPQLELTQVATGYRDLFHRKEGVTNAKAGSCEIDVVCPAAAPWASETRSVARISIDGTALCSGTLIMDASGDFRAFFLTANHCGISSGNAATVVVYWNYQSPTCGQNGLGGSLAQNQSGATFRAAKSDVDFSLIELNQLPPAAFHVYYAGWDRSGTAPSGGVGIHHPNGGGKCISFSISPFSTINSCIDSGGVDSHWQVPWQSPPHGVTEPGSSGSGIWDSTSHLLVGTLSGGPSACDVTPASLWDCYGKFSVAWASGINAASRLQNWLDPHNTGVASVLGADPSPVFLSPAGATLLAEGCLPTNGVVDPGEVVTVSFALQNIGIAPTTNLVATLLAAHGVIAPSDPQNYGALSAGGLAVARAFTFMASGPCGGKITPKLQLQDGEQNLGTATFSLTLGLPTVTASQNFDGVSAPTLPSGWSASPRRAWVTTSAQHDTLPNSAFASDPKAIKDQQLTSPSFLVTSGSAQLTFQNYYDTQYGYDGGVLEISINGGGFADILSSGGAFLTGGYNGLVATGFGNPLAGRSAWTGNSGGYLLTTVALPAAAAGGSVQLRWRLGSDSSVSATGWYVDTIVLGDYSCCTGAPPPAVNFAANPTSGAAPLTVVFTNLSFGATAYAWDFGDGNTSTNVNPANLYTNAGSYTVSLTANGPGGTNTLTQTNYVVVTNPPPPIILQPTLIAWGLQFSFLTVAGVTYQVEYKDALTESLWQPLESILGDGTLKFFTNSVPPPAQRFYRISVH